MISVPRIDLTTGSLDLGPVTVLVGRNGSGKTAALDAIERAAPTGTAVRRLRSGEREQVRASFPDHSDGALQLRLVRHALLLHNPDLVLLDEPDLSLDLAAILTVAHDIRFACDEAECQVVIATHSPVLMSQFEAVEVVVLTSAGPRRVSEIENVQDLLEQYALGSLYMSGALDL